jgi:acyl carrier protein
MPDTHMPGLSQINAIGSDAAVLAEITDVVRQVLHDRTIELAADTAIDDTPGWDSMSHIAILVEAECRFDVIFEIADVDTLPTVGHLVRLVQAKRSIRHSAEFVGCRRGRDNA